ncbi:hypothetical protein RQP46_006194 [Phenoliferia psychrophenolica]
MTKPPTPPPGASADKASLDKETVAYALPLHGDISTSKISYTREEEMRLIRKLDMVLIPGLTLLYTLSFLDRTNTKLFGLLKDLKITDPADYNTALAIYFVGYVLFEVPANIVLKKLDPKRWLPVLTIVWGITATLQGLVTSRSGFFAARFFMGVTEAGLFPGCVFVLSMYYKLTATDSWAIGHIKSFGSRPNWAAIFFIEGMLTVLVGLTAFLWVPGYPHDATFLTSREREILLARLAADGDSADREPFQWSQVWSAFKDPLVIAYSLSLFLPTIIAGLGYASWKAQLMTVPPYAMAFMSMIGFAYVSHIFNRRGIFIIVGAGVAILGYIILLATETSGARYAGTFFCVIGIYSGNALLAI